MQNSKLYIIIVLVVVVVDNNKGKDTQLFLCCHFPKKKRCEKARERECKSGARKEGRNNAASK